MKEIGPELPALNKRKIGETFNQINDFFRVRNTRGVRQPKNPSLEYNKIWLPLPETCQNLEKLTPVQRKKFENFSELSQRGSLKPQSNGNDEEKILKQFD